MSHSHNADANHEASNAAAMAEIKKVTILLSVLTVIELILGFWMIGISSVALRLAIKGVIIILMMAKAFYIVAYFMHLKHEVKNMIMTIIVPLLLFVWFIGAFLCCIQSIIRAYESLLNSCCIVIVEVVVSIIIAQR